MNILTLTEGHHKNYLALIRLIFNLSAPSEFRSARGLSSKQRRRLRKRKLVDQKNTCPSCGSQFSKQKSSKHYPTIEHVIPYQYGSSKISNIILLCFTCNQKRSKMKNKKLIKYVEDHYGIIDHSLIDVDLLPERQLEDVS